MTQRKTTIAIALIGVAAIFFTFFYSTPPIYVRTSADQPTNVKTSAGKPAPDENIFLRCETLEDKSERDNCHKDAALEAMRKGIGLEELAQYASGYDSHLKQHAIGRAMLIVSDYDLEKVKEICAPSNCIHPYYHGISEEWGKYAPLDVGKLVAFLESVCPIHEIPGCYHNIGHFYQSNTENFEKSVALCDELQDNDRFYHCAYGLVHEQFIQSNGENFFQLCKNKTDRGKTACYTIGSRLYPKWFSYKPNGENLLKLCDEVNEEIPAELNYCYASAAWVLENEGEALDLAWCEHLEGQTRELCVKGLRSPQPFWDVLGCSLQELSQCGL